MLIRDYRAIGNKLLAIRKKAGLTQIEVAELAGVSDRTYADIERGTVNMRLETLLSICKSLKVTPNEILTEEQPENTEMQNAILEQLFTCSPKERQTAFELLNVYLKSLQS